MARIAAWLDERLGIGCLWRGLFARQVPVGLNWAHSLGAATLFVLVLQTVTGILLALNYAPSPEHAYDSVQYITGVVPQGWLLRGLHHWGASAMVVLVGLHLLSAFLLGGHTYPREATWLTGVLLLLVTVGFGFTGYLLPWDQKAYWATTVGTNMSGTAPVIGPALVRLLRGGSELGAVTLARFYAIHVLVLPVLVGLLATVHLALVVWHGVSVPPRLWHRGLRAGRAAAAAAAPDPAVAAALGPLPDPPRLTAERYHERYAAFKAHGPRFWPELIAADAKVVLLVLAVLLGLTLIVGVPTEAQADPTDRDYIPRPEWYFMFLFQLVKYFPGHLEWVGVLVVPGLIVLFLALLPFLPGGQERRPLRRPLGLGLMGVLLVSMLGLTVEGYRTTPPSRVVEQGALLTSQQLRGRQLVAQQGCRSCHVINGEGDRRKAPPLDGIAERMTAADVHFFMERPRALNPAASMEPVIPPLSHEEVEAITQYLLTLPADILPKEGTRDGKRARR